MGYCYEIIPINDDLIGLRFENGFIMIDLYNFSTEFVELAKKEKVEDKIKNLLQTIKEFYSEDIAERSTLQIRNILKDVDKNKIDLENIDILYNKEELKKILSVLQSKAEQLDDHNISVALEKLIFNLIKNPEFFENLQDNLFNHITQETALTIKKAPLLMNNKEQFNAIFQGIDNPYGRSFFYGIIDAYLNNTPSNKQNIEVLLSKLKDVQKTAIFTTFKSSLQGEYDGQKVISYLGKNRDSHMPANTFLRYLESNYKLDIKEMSSIIPKEGAVDIFGENSIGSEELYLLAGKGNIDDDRVAKTLQERRKENKKISKHTEMLITEQIKKEIRGQGAEEGIYVREIFQNVGDAVLKQDQVITERNIFQINTWQEINSQSNEQYFVEKYKDNGVGISSLANLLVAQVNQKTGKETGFFGSGFLSIFEDGDIVEIKTSTGNGQTKYLQIAVRKGEDNKAIGFDILQYKRTEEQYSGTEIIRKTKIGKDKIAELEQGLLEVNILKNTALWNVDLEGNQKLETYLNGKRIEKQSKLKHQEFFEINDEQFNVKIEQGKFSQLAHGNGLRMSDLDKKYLKLVPKQIIDIIQDLNLSIILDKKFPLIKDRSQLAKENDYLLGIQKAVATAITKTVTKELLTSRRKFTGWSDDYFNNPHYHLSYDGKDGQRIISLAKKINKKEELLKEDWQWLSSENDPTSRLARLVVLMETDYKGNNVTLHSERIKMLQKIQEQINDDKLRDIIQKENANLRVYSHEDHDIHGIQDSPITPSFMYGLGITELNLNSTLEDVNSSELDEKEERVLNSLQKFLSVYQDKIEIKVIQHSGSAGKFRKNPFGKDEFLVDRSVLNGTTAKLIETAVHEMAHYKEGTENHCYNFSHQTQGVFGDKYKEVVNEMLA